MSESDHGHEHQKSSLLLQEAVSAGCNLENLLQNKCQASMHINGLRECARKSVFFGNVLDLCFLVFLQDTYYTYEEHNTPQNLLSCYGCYLIQ